MGWVWGSGFLIHSLTVPDLRKVDWLNGTRNPWISILSLPTGTHPGVALAQGAIGMYGNGQDLLPALQGCPRGLPTIERIFMYEKYGKFFVSIFFPLAG